MNIVNLTFVFDRKGQASKTKTGVVELRITHEGKRKYFSTGVKLYPKQWSNGSVVGRRDWKELNAQLQLLHKKCSEIITKMMEDDMLDIAAIPNILRDRMTVKQTFMDFCRECARLKMKDLRIGTQKRYKVVLDFLEEWKGLYHFADVTEQNIRKMDEVLEKRGLKECSRYNYHKLVKMFVAEAFNDGLIPKNPYAKVKIKRGDNSGIERLLTPQEFHDFERCVIPVAHLRKVRDLFVFQTYTMMSYSDLCEFDAKKCVEMDGELVYKSKRQKTGQEFTLVLLPPAKAILKQYDGKLPIISNAKYNDYLKAAVAYAKISKPVTTHWARHTGATMLLNDGNIPMHIVQHILGHASIRETEKTYAKVLDKTIVETMANYEVKASM